MSTNGCDLGLVSSISLPERFSGQDHTVLRYDASPNQVDHLSVNQESSDSLQGPSSTAGE